MSRVRAYVELIKFRYHITYLTVIFSAAIFYGRLDKDLLRSLAEFYFCFNVLLYGGIYTLNDLRDMDSDSQHPRKKHRPIASGRVSPSAARVFSASLIVAGLTGVYLLFGQPVFFVCLVIFACDLLYSFAARNVPYVDLVVNTVTHPLRFLLGALLVGRSAPWLHLGAYFFFVLGLSCLRRELEKDIKGWEARPTLKAYSPRALVFMEIGSFACILLFLLADNFKSPVFYAAVVPTYGLLVLGARVLPPVRSALHSIWTR